MIQLTQLYKTGKNVFTIDEIGQITQTRNRESLHNSLRYLARVGKIHRIRRGIYSLDKEYSELELAQRLVIPSYVSLYTALGIHGINFQYHRDITSIALYNKTMNVDDRTYKYHRIKPEIFYLPDGIEKREYYNMASPERAVVDTLYFFPEHYFDNIAAFNHKKAIIIAEKFKLDYLVQRIEML